jgi:hypothetical protein
MIGRGQIKRVVDEDIQSASLELQSGNINSTFVTCPGEARMTLGIKHPLLVLVIKNLGKSFGFEVQVLDDENVRRRFCVGNFVEVGTARHFSCTLPLKFEPGWNMIQFDLGDFTHRVFNTNYREALRLQIHATCRIRRVYFCDRQLLEQNRLPRDYTLKIPPPTRPLLVRRSAMNSATGDNNSVGDNKDVGGNKNIGINKSVGDIKKLKDNKNLGSKASS